MSSSQTQSRPTEKSTPPFVLYIADPKVEDAQYNADGVAVYVYNSAPPFFKKWFAVVDLRDPRHFASKPAEVKYTPQLYDVHQRKFYLAGTSTINALLILAFKANIYCDIRKTNFASWPNAMVPAGFMQPPPQPQQAHTIAAPHPAAAPPAAARTPSAPAAATRSVAAPTSAAVQQRRNVAPASSSSAIGPAAPPADEAQYDMSMMMTADELVQMPLDVDASDIKTFQDRQRQIIEQEERLNKYDMTGNVRDCAVSNMELQSCFEFGGEALNSEMRLAHVDYVGYEDSNEELSDTSRHQARRTGPNSALQGLSEQMYSGGADANMAPETIVAMREKQNAMIAQAMEQQRMRNQQQGDSVVASTDSRKLYESSAADYGGQVQQQSAHGMNSLYAQRQNVMAQSTRR